MTRVSAPLRWSSHASRLRLAAIPSSIGGSRSFQTRSKLDEVSATIPLPKEQGSLTASVTPDASFQVLGSPFSLLSVKLSPSQPLYTRRGTLVGLSGKSEDVVSTLSVLSPVQRAISAVPFLYQKVTSTSPVTATIGTNTTSSSFATVYLDGRVDWMIAQRNALLCWTGHNLVLKPKLNFQMNIAHWGNTYVTGRGILALVGRGQVYQINLAADEEYIVHPKNIVAYSIGSNSPLPFRFKSLVRFQLPSISSYLPNTRFFHEMRKTAAWQWTASVIYTVQTWARRSIWGDRLFLTFKGPATVLVQSRGSSIVDSVSSREINDIADSPAGSTLTAWSKPPVRAIQPGTSTTAMPSQPAGEPVAVKHAVMGPDGKFKIS